MSEDEGRSTLAAEMLASMSEYCDTIESGDSISSRLQAAIRGRGLSIRAVAREAGIASSVVSRWMRGERDILLATADRIVRALRVSPTGCAGSPADTASPRRADPGMAPIPDPGRAPESFQGVPLRPEELDTLVRIIGDHPEEGLRRIGRRFHEKTGRPLGENTVRKYRRQLVDRGVLSVSRESPGMRGLKLTREEVAGLRALVRDNPGAGPKELVAKYAERYGRRIAKETVAKYRPKGRGGK